MGRVKSDPKILGGENGDSVLAPSVWIINRVSVFRSANVGMANGTFTHNFAFNPRASEIIDFAAFARGIRMP